MKTKLLIPLIALLFAACNNNCEQSTRGMIDKMVILEQGLTSSTNLISQNNHHIYSLFEKQYEINAEKVKPWKDRAFQIRQRADEIYYKLQELKIMICEHAEENEAILTKDDVIVIEPMYIAQKNNIDIPHQLLIVEENGKKVKALIKDFRAFILNMINEINAREEVIAKVEIYLDTYNRKDYEKGEELSWETYHFENTPIIAAIATLSKIQCDIRSAELTILNYLHTMISGSGDAFNKIHVFVNTKTNIIKQGENYKVELFLGAYDSTAQYKIWIGEYNKSNFHVDENNGFWLPEESFKDGKGIYLVEKPKPGNHEYKGFITINGPRGPHFFEFKGDFEVIE